MVVKKASAKKKKKETKVKVTTPIGILSYPHLAEPDTGRSESSGKYSTDLLIPKSVWKKEAGPLKAAVLKVGRAYFKDDSLELGDFTNPFKDTDKLDKYSESDRAKGCVLIRAKSEFAPVIIDASKEDLSEKEIQAIKGGDEARLVVAVYGYPQQDGGVTLGLNLVQYIKSGEALGGGKAALLAEVDEVEVELDDIETDEEEDDEPVIKKKSKKAKTAIEDDEEDEIEEEDDEDEEPKKKRGRPAAVKSKKKAAIEEDDEEVEEDEEEVAKTKKKAPPVKKVKKKASVNEDDDDDFNFDD